MTDIMRPTFEVSVRHGVEDTLRRLRTVYEEEPRDGQTVRIVGQIAGQHMTMTVHKDDRHFWSPWLTLHVFLSEEQGATEQDVMVWGRFSPHPRVWSAYLLGYVALAIIGMISLGWGLSQWSLEQPPTVLFACGATVLIALAMLWSSRLGQSFARQHMRLIYRAVCAALETEPVHIRSES